MGGERGGMKRERPPLSYIILNIKRTIARSIRQKIGKGSGFSVQETEREAGFASIFLDVRQECFFGCGFHVWENRGRVGSW